MEQSYKKGSLETVISTLQKLVEREENVEIKAIYGSGPHSLSKQYSKFKIGSVKWHSMAGDYREKHVKKFRMYKPTLDDEYVKPKKSGKKPSDGGKWIRKQQETEVILGRHAKRIRIEDPNYEPEIPFELFFRSFVPRLVEKGQGNCGRKLSQSNEENYLLIKSNGPTAFLVNGEDRTKVGPPYVHFNQICLKEYLHRIHNVQAEEFPYESIIIDRKTLNMLTDEECACLSSYGLHIQ